MPTSALDLGRLPWTLETTETVTSLTAMDALAAHQFTAAFACNLRESGIHTYSIVLGKDPDARGTQWKLWAQFARLDEDHACIVSNGSVEKWWQRLRTGFLARIGVSTEQAGNFFSPCSEAYGTHLLAILKSRTHVVLYRDIPYVLYKLGNFYEEEWSTYGELYAELMSDPARIDDLNKLCFGKYGWPEWRCVPLYQQLFYELAGVVGEARLGELESEIEEKGLSDWDLITWYRSTYLDLVGNEVDVPERREAIWAELRLAQGPWERVHKAVAPGDLAEDEEMRVYLAEVAEAERVLREQAEAQDDGFESDGADIKEEEEEIDFRQIPLHVTEIRKEEEEVDLEQIPWHEEEVKVEEEINLQDIPQAEDDEMEL
ncbi:hypothetical protein BDW74DRAFT_182444 [Aspergillus multicolor]|uniref:uncharacterized protein n=1 Tax=Aspergillus multicolor TaxID=41759 RepID=UPI003CCD5C05